MSISGRIRRDPAVVGMLAIENTIAGSLLHNYELLRESGTTVVGEHKLHIEHAICCLPEDDWDTITAPRCIPIPWPSHSAAPFFPAIPR